MIDNSLQIIQNTQDFPNYEEIAILIIINNYFNTGYFRYTPGILNCISVM